MDFIHFTAGKDDSERRLDRVLRNFLSEEHLSSIYKSLRKGLIKVNGKKCDGNFRISQGDDIQIAVFLLKESHETCPPEAKSQSSAEEGSREGASQNKELKADRQTMDEMTTNAGKQVRTPDR